MKNLIVILTTLLTVFTATASASIMCKRTSCKSDPNLVSDYDFCADFISFEFELEKNSIVLITSLDRWNKKNQYFAEGTSSNPQQIGGASEDLLAQFNIDAKLKKGHLVMYQRGTGLVSADFKLRCIGKL